MCNRQSNNPKRNVVFCQNCWQRRASIFDLFCHKCGAEYIMPLKCECKNCTEDAEPGTTICTTCREFFEEAGARHDAV